MVIAAYHLVMSLLMRRAKR